MSVNVSAIAQIFDAMGPIFDRAGPIIIFSLALSFIRSIYG